MDIVGKHLKTLREGINLSQVKLAKLCDSTQSNINRYENGQAATPYKLLRWYADYFDVSLDYIFGRTDNPQGKQYAYEAQYIKDKAEKNEELEQFVEMCFDPKSPMNDKLKHTLLSMLKGESE